MSASSGVTFTWKWPVTIGSWAKSSCRAVTRVTRSHFFATRPSFSRQKLR